MNTNIADEVNEEKSEDKPKLKAVELAILQELKKKKQDALMQLGSLKEMEMQFLDQLKDVNNKLNEKDQEIRKEYNIPSDMFWQIDAKTQEISIVSPDELVNKG